MASLAPLPSPSAEFILGPASGRIRGPTPLPSGRGFHLSYFAMRRFWIEPAMASNTAASWAESVTS
jgi:hypothetical protein